jgi:hypothetical protein
MDHQHAHRLQCFCHLFSDALEENRRARPFFLVLHLRTLYLSLVPVRVT